jgi:hypothetical protein
MPSRRTSLKIPSLRFMPRTDGVVLTTSDTIVFIGKCLCYDETDSSIPWLQSSLLNGRIDWVRVVETANQNGVTPALWQALNRKGLAALLPTDLHKYLALICDLNRRRNRMIRGEAVEAISAMNARGLRPILMKGSISLFEAGSDDESRMMTDIDLLLQEQHISEGFRALHSLGYVVLGKMANKAHAWAFHRPSSLVTIDLHRHVGPQRDLLTPQAALHRAMPIVCDVEVHSLSPTDRALLLGMTFGIFEMHYWNGHIPLKGLHDLAALCSRLGNKIDWGLVAATAAAHQFEASQAAWSYMASHLMGVQLPISAHQTIAAKRHLQRCFLQLSLPILDRVILAGVRLAWPFNCLRMDYWYSCGTSGRRLAAARLRHAFGILARRNPFRQRHSPPQLRQA